jgi:predicted kinase
MKFELFFHEFAKSSLWYDMLNTRENTIFHQEENVAEHTRLCLKWYQENLANSRTEYQQLMTKLAILFHDVGKPKAQHLKTSESRGTFNCYAGHELISANLFENYILQNNSLNLFDTEIRQLKWMIENHLPYDKNKNEFKLNMYFSLGYLVQAYYDVLLSDANGRITTQNRTDKVIEWIDNNKNVTLPEQKQSTKIAYVLHGASNSGKSTYSRSLLEQDLTLAYFNLDEIRVNFFKDNEKQLVEQSTNVYNDAYHYSIKNKNRFNQYSQLIFNSIINKNQNIIVDNTHCSVKARRRFITVLKQHDYFIQGIEFQATLKTLDERRKVTNKLPYSHLESQYFTRNLLRYDSEIDQLRLINIEN